MSESASLLEGFALDRPTTGAPRVVIAIDGRERQGKTHFCLTAPGPIVYLDFDMGGEGVIEKFKDRGKTILCGPPFVAKPAEVLEGGDQGDEDAAAKLAQREWQRFHVAYLRALRKPAVRVNGRSYMARTVIIDTGSEMYEALRLAYFGKLVSVPTFLYRETNSIMRDIVRQALDSNTNLILTHKMTAEWKKVGEKQGKTGVYERKGFDEMGHLVQANLFAYRAPLPNAKDATWQFKIGTGEPHVWTTEPRGDTRDLGFRLRILDSRHNPELEGIELANEQATFSQVAQMLIDGTTEKDWTDVA